MKRETFVNSNKLLAHLHRLATGFAATGNDRLSNEMLTLIDAIERGEFNQGTKGTNMSQYDHSNNERIAANEADISNMKHWIEEIARTSKLYNVLCLLEWA